MQSAGNGRTSRRGRRRARPRRRAPSAARPSGLSLGRGSGRPSVLPPVTPPSARGSVLPAVSWGERCGESGLVRQPPGRSSGVMISPMSNACMRRGTRSRGPCERPSTTTQCRRPHLRHFRLRIAASRPGPLLRLPLPRLRHHLLLALCRHRRLHHQLPRRVLCRHPRPSSRSLAEATTHADRPPKNRRNHSYVSSSASSTP